MRIVWHYINQKGGECAVILLLLVFLYPISRQKYAVSLYTVLVLLRIWILLIIPAFGEILRQWYAKVSARPSLSSTHYGLQRQCSARVTRRSASVEKPPQGRHFHLAGVIMLINVGRAATEEHTAAAAAEQTPGKTVTIAEKSALSTDFPLRAERNRKIVIPPPQAPAERQTSGLL